MLIPAKLLVNGASIVVDTECRFVTWYHVELDQHDVLLADGLPTESYLDTGNRAMFANGDAPVRLHPDFAGDQWLRETLSCAPFAGDAAQVAPVWRALADRADALGWSLPEHATSADPDLHILVGDRRIEPVDAKDGRYVFAIPAGDAPLRLMSRAVRPCEVTPWIDEPRRLGVLVRRLIARTGSGLRAVAMDAPELGRGWWEAEWHAQGAWEGPCRWTDGDALLPDVGAGLLEVVLGGTVTYPVAAAAGPMDAAAGTETPIAAEARAA
jgi:hypothetical protein